MRPYAGVDTSRLLVSAMQVAEMNHRVLANNVANADTPHFNPKHVDFQKTLREQVEGHRRIALRTTQPRHVDLAAPRPHFERLAMLSKNDYNKVDLEEEMARLSENSGRFNTYATLLTKRFERVKGMLSNLR